MANQAISGNLPHVGGTSTGVFMTDSHSALAGPIEGNLPCRRVCQWGRAH